MKWKTALWAAVLIGGNLTAQKKPLDHSVYDSWQNLSATQISNDGNWTAYNINPQEGDPKLYLTPLNRTGTLEFDRGTGLYFTSDSRFAVFKIKPFYKDIKAVTDKKLKKEKLTKDSLAVVDLKTGKVTKYPDLKSFSVPRKGGSWLAYLTALPKDSSRTEKPAASQKAEDIPGNLVLKNLATGKEKTFDRVLRYLISENGKSAVFVTQKEPEKKKKDTLAKKDSLSEGKLAEKKDPAAPKKYQEETVQWVNLDKGDVRTLQKSLGNFSDFALTRDGSTLAFLGTHSAKNDLVKDFKLYIADAKKMDSLSPKEGKLPKDWVVSEFGKPYFSKNGAQLFFGVSPRPIPKDTALIANDHAVVDIWNYKDDYLQPQQLKNLDRDLKKTYLAALQTDSPTRFVALGDEDVDVVRPLAEGNSTWALGSTNKGSRIEVQWRGYDYKDYYLIDTKTGERTPIIQHLYGRVQTSPLGRFVVYFNREDHTWYAYDVAERKVRNLSGEVPVAFTQELWDQPSLAPAYGIAAWTDQDESVLIRDRYDLWEFSLNGKFQPRNVTRGYGRKNKVTFDTFLFDPEDVKSLSRKKEILLSAFYEENKDQGLFKTKISGTTEPQKVIVEPVWGYTTLKKAKNAEQYILTKETYEQSPNLYATRNFAKQTRLTETNPQQKQYWWGTDELVHWTTDEGHAATGVLFKPENFDPNKKYPMIVYFYETLSDNLHQYVQPEPTRSRLNISFFVSRGYLVFTPDIAYTIGHPGKSAADYIDSSVEYLKKNAWVDGAKIGIQGQSWGGYQVAYLITETNKYAAAWSGAPVVNMTSAYGGIRWGSGMNRQFQYEQTQSRIGKPLWEAFDLYIENSPLFHFENVTTPVVIMHNDQDGAVPWYQGIEMFTGLRRLGKKVWMLNYNGDDHNLLKRQNKKDIQIREQQFFDHYLKGAQASAWMTRGVPATMKGKDWGFELTNEEP